MENGIREITATSPNRAYLASANAFVKIGFTNASPTSDTLVTLYSIDFGTFKKSFGFFFNIKYICKIINYYLSIFLCLLCITYRFKMNIVISIVVDPH